PEDPDIVARHYTDAYRETLAVKPGLTSPGSVYYYAVGEETLQHGDAVDAYVERLLPVKIALDRVYVREASVPYDVSLILRTAAVILARAAGRRRFPDPPELRRCRPWGRSRRPPRPGRARPAPWTSSSSRPASPPTPRPSPRPACGPCSRTATA